MIFHYCSPPLNVPLISYVININKVAISFTMLTHNFSSLLGWHGHQLSTEMFHHHFISRSETFRIPIRFLITTNTPDCVVCRKAIIQCAPIRIYKPVSMQYYVAICLCAFKAMQWGEGVVGGNGGLKDREISEHTKRRRWLLFCT